MDEAAEGYFYECIDDGNVLGRKNVSNQPTE